MHRNLLRFPGDIKSGEGLVRKRVCSDSVHLYLSCPHKGIPESVRSHSSCTANWLCDVRQVTSLSEPPKIKELN